MDEATENTGTDVAVSDPTSDPLWRRIEAFEFDADGTLLSFAERLARENGWTEAFAARVITEYRRFCYLALTADHPVTPSDAVDQAWHLHLTYSENYWDEFCTKTLGQKLHHGPTRGGGEEQAKYRDWYENTLAAYKRIAGEAPPEDIWPNTARRFHGVEAMRRVNAADNLIIPKPSQGVLWVVQIAFGIGFGISAATGYLYWTLFCITAVFVLQRFRAKQKQKERILAGDRGVGAGAFWLGCAGGGWGGGGGDGGGSDGGGSGCGGCGGG